MSENALSVAADERGSAYRQRLLDGLAESIRENGFAGSKVADVVRHARTSRRTFYEHFSSLEDCYIGLMKSENNRVATEIANAVDPHAKWKKQVGQAIRAWSVAAVAEPALMRSWIREFPSLGDLARDLQREINESLIVLVSALTDTEDFRAGGIAPPSRETSILLLGGLSELMVSSFEDGVAIDIVAEAATASTIALLSMNKIRSR